MDNRIPVFDFENSKSEGIFENALPPQTYVDFVMSHKKPADQMLISLSARPVRIDLWHMATGIAGECGEVLGLILEFQRDIRIINELRERAKANIPPPPFVKGLFERHSDVAVATFFDINILANHAIGTEFCKKMILELGDIEFYLEGFRQALGLNRVMVVPAASEIRTFQTKYEPSSIDDVPARLTKLGLDLLDHVKKVAVYEKEIDSDFVVKTLVEIEFHTWIIRDWVDTNLAEVLHMNEVKLRKRFKSGKYSNQEAVERADVNAMSPGQFDQLTQAQLDG